MLGQKTRLNKLRKTEIISSIFYDHNDIKQQMNNMKKTEKFTNMWRLNNQLLKMNGSNTKSKRNKKKYHETNENGNVTNPNLWDAAKAVPRRKSKVKNSFLKK